MLGFEILSIGPAARRLGVCPGTLRKWSDLGKICPMRDSANRRLFTRAQIDAFLLARERERQEAAIR